MYFSAQVIQHIFLYFLLYLTIFILFLALFYSLVSKMPRSAVGVTERRSNLNLAWSLTWRNEIAAAAGLLPKRKHKFCCSSERNIFCPVSAFSFHEHQQRLHTSSTRGGAWNDEDKSAPGFFIIQRIIISCLRMAKGGIHPRIGLQSVMTGYCFLVNIIILLVLIRQIRGHYDADVLHHHGGRQCSHQHPKAHEVRSDYDFTYHSIVVVCDFTNFVHAWGNFLLKIWSCHMSRRNITGQSTQITK